MYTTLVWCVVFKNSCICLPCCIVSQGMGTRRGVFYQRLSLLALLSTLLWTPCRSCRSGPTEGLRRPWPQCSPLIPFARDVLGCSVLLRMTKTPRGLCWWMCAHLKVPRYLTMVKKEGEVCACIYLFLTGQFVLPAAEGIWLREVLLPSWESLVRSKK